MTGAPGSQVCLNCGHADDGEYCSRCGQRHGDLHHSIRELVAQGTGSEGFSKTSSSLRLLVTRPGFLTAESWAGRRARYVHPLRQYLSVSALVFLAFAWWPSLLLSRGQGFNLTIEHTGDRAPGRTAPDAGEGFSLTLVGKPGQALDDASFHAGVSRAREELAKEQPGSWLEKHLVALGLRVANRAEGKTEADFQGEWATHFAKNLPRMVFILLPVFALLLKLFLRRPPRYYAEHLIFAFHTHSFFLLAFLGSRLVAKLVPLDPDLVSDPVIAAYLFLALRRAYQLSVWRTAIRFGLLLVSYSFIFVLGWASVAVLSLVQLGSGG